MAENPSDATEVQVAGTTPTLTSCILAAPLSPDLQLQVSTNYQLEERPSNPWHWFIRALFVLAVEDYSPRGTSTMARTMPPQQPKIKYVSGCY